MLKTKNKLSRDGKAMAERDGSVCELDNSDKDQASRSKDVRWELTMLNTKNWASQPQKDKLLVFCMQLSSEDTNTESKSKNTWKQATHWEMTLYQWKQSIQSCDTCRSD